MGVFPRFGRWINQNSKQTLKAESKRSENVDSEKEDFELPEKLYHDVKEELRQRDLWHEAEKKHPWHNASPKIKVTHENGFYHMNIEMTVGLTPELLYNFLIDPDSASFFDLHKMRQLMENKSRKVLLEKGPRQITSVKKSVVCNVFGVYIPISMNLIVDEDSKDHITLYEKEKGRFMKELKGDYKLEPVFVDKERFCKKKIPKTREEYKKCSGGKGKVAAKLTLDQSFQPYPPFNIPPLSWFIRGLTIKTSKALLASVQDKSIAMRTAIPLQPQESK